MKKEEFKPWDVNRIPFGEVPLKFMVEAFTRTVFIFYWLLLAC